MTTVRTVATATVAMVVAGCGVGIALGDAGAAGPEQTPTTLAPTPVPTVPGVPTTFDNSTGPLTSPSGGGTLPVYATCEDAILAPTSTDTCSEAAVEGFNLFGGKLGLLYSSDLPISLGVWAPVGDHDWEFNESVLYACIGVLNEEDELVWLDYQLLTYTDYSATANEKLFDAAMAYVCPELGYTRSAEWDFHVPAEFLTPSTTVASNVPGPTGPTGPSGVPTVPPVGPTTVAPATSAPAATTVPATTVTTVASVIPTVSPTAGSSELTTSINTSSGPQDYSCSDIISIRDTVTPCDPAVQAVFDSIVTADAGAFDSYIYEADLGWFSTTEVNVPETAFVGLWACASAASGVSYVDYDTYVRGVFTPASPADTQKAWDAAFAVLCPSLAPG